MKCLILFFLIFLRLKCTQIVSVSMFEKVVLLKKFEEIYSKTLLKYVKRAFIYSKKFKISFDPKDFYRRKVIKRK